MADLNYCAGDGFWVGPERTLPDDDWHHHRPRPGAWDVVGCSRLRCLDCGAWVRSAVGVQDNERTYPNLPAVYEERDWSGSPNLAHGARGGRLYLCRCRLAMVWRDGAQNLATSQESLVRGPTWRCAGHPHGTGGG
jgi:hypothetical protein